MRSAMLLALALSLAAPTSAHATRCPHGQILRVHLSRCVAAHSRLALEVWHGPGRSWHHRHHLRPHHRFYDGGRPTAIRAKERVKVATRDPIFLPYTLHGSVMFDKQLQFFWMR